MDACVRLGIAAACRSLPDDLVAEGLGSENQVHNGLEVVVGCGIVAVQVDAPVRLQDAVHFQ